MKKVEPIVVMVVATITGAICAVVGLHLGTDCRDCAMVPDLKLVLYSNADSVKVATPYWIAKTVKLPKKLNGHYVFTGLNGDEICIPSWIFQSDPILVEEVTLEADSILGKEREHFYRITFPIGQEWGKKVWCVKESPLALLRGEKE